MGVDIRKPGGLKTPCKNFFLFIPPLKIIVLITTINLNLLYFAGRKLSKFYSECAVTSDIVISESTIPQPQSEIADAHKDKKNNWILKTARL